MPFKEDAQERWSVEAVDKGGICNLYEDPGRRPSPYFHGLRNDMDAGPNGLISPFEIEPKSDIGSQ